jgi:prepilin-type N-terminal cleavage/methylation domain-containing protein
MRLPPLCLVNLMQKRNAFTLIELLVVISLISAMTTIALPSLMTARELARSTQCQNNLKCQALAMSMYHFDYNGSFWPYKRGNWPRAGVATYFWGSDTNPVDPSASGYVAYLPNNLESLWCPEMPWGSYIPQGMNVVEPTTTYGYNAFYLDVKLNGKILKQIAMIPRPDELFVLADTALSWSPGGVVILQNSTYMEPVTGNWVQQPTNHFRHHGLTNAMCADGHVQSYGPSGWTIDNEQNLGFVGTSNDPHYAQ